MRIGIWIWPSFTALDLYMCVVLYPSAPLSLFIAYRIAIECIFVFAYRDTLRPAISLRRLRVEQNLAFFAAALGITLMAIHLGGLRSAYMHGISLVCLVHAAMLPSHWRNSLLVFVPIGLVFPVVMGITALVSPAERTEWLSLKSVAIFASNYVFVIASSIIGMVSGHAVWAAQQQVYRARQLGRYRLQAPIGTGGMGQVWLAWDGTLHRNVALKLLRVSGDSPQSLVTRFEREAHAASRLRGPHTVHIYDFGASDDGIHYIAMEYLVGADLYTLVIEHGPFPPARAVRLVMQACLSLEEAHAAGIIHRDIKPQNLFVTQVGEDFDFLKLLDFGIARIRAGEFDSQLTRIGVFSGTPAFMAPELWQGADADPRSDIYALGATLYFLLTGAPPFEGEAVAEFREAHVGQDPKTIASRCCKPVSEGLERTVHKCLAKSPADRFQSARELRTALAELDDPQGWTASDAEGFWRHVRPVR